VGRRLCRFNGDGIIREALGTASGVGKSDGNADWDVVGVE